MDPRIARKCHKPVQNAILWEKNAKVEDYAGFWAFCRKNHEIFTNPVFKNPGIYIYIYIQGVIFRSKLTAKFDSVSIYSIYMQ